MIFNLSNVKGVNTSKPRLKGNEIHDVIFKGVTVISGTKASDGNPWHAMDIRFEDATGAYYVERIFMWDDKAGERTYREGKDGMKFPNPTRLEQAALTIAQVGEMLSPDVYAKFQKMSFDLPKEFVKMAETFAKCMKPAEGKTTKLKLINQKDGTPRLPYFVRVNKEEEAYISNNWLGDEVGFTPYEVKAMSAEPKAAPTVMPDFSPATTAGSEDPFDLDLDIK